MYRVVKNSMLNGVSLPYYKCERGNNSLEGFHKFLPNMIPGKIIIFLFCFFKGTLSRNTGKKIKVRC